MSFPDKHRARSLRLRMGMTPHGDVPWLHIVYKGGRPDLKPYMDSDWEWRRHLIREERRAWMAELHVPSRRKRKAMASRCAVGVVDQQLEEEGQ